MGLYLFVLTTMGRPHFSDISQSGYGTDVPLMQSWFLHIFLSTPVGDVVLAVSLLLIVKEFTVRSLERRLVINLFTMVAFGALSFLFVWNLYSPVFAR